MSRFISIFLSVLFILGLLISPAQAQGGTTGYLVLVSHSDPNATFYLQARQAFNRLSPHLMQAKKEGHLSGFEPDFSAGIVKLELPAGIQAANLLNNLMVYSNIHEAMQNVKRNPDLENSDNQEITTTISPTFHLQWRSSCFYTSGLGDSSHIIGSLRDKTGRLVASFNGISDTFGFLNDCFDGSGAYTSVMPGYTVTFKAYDTVSTLLGTYTMVVPNAISVTAVNKTSSILSGKGPASKAFSAYWVHPYLNNASNTKLTVFKTGNISATGNWTTDFGVIPFRGGDFFNISIDFPNFSFSKSADVPFAYCELGSNYCGMYGIPGTFASLTIKHAGATYTTTGTFNYWGYFIQELEDATGSPIFLVSGDSMFGINIPSWTLVNLTATLNTTTDVISGKAPANKWFYLCGDQSNNYNSWCNWRQAKSTGSYIENLSGLVDFLPNTAYWLEVDYTNPVTGNEEYMYQSVAP